jgi:hypothetical protein
MEYQKVKWKKITMKWIHILNHFTIDPGFVVSLINNYSFNFPNSKSSPASRSAGPSTLRLNSFFDPRLRPGHSSRGDFSASDDEEELMSILYEMELQSASYSFDHSNNNTTQPEVNSLSSSLFQLDLIQPQGTPNRQPTTNSDFTPQPNSNNDTLGQLTSLNSSSTTRRRIKSSSTEVINHVFLFINYLISVRRVLILHIVGKNVVSFLQIMKFRARKTLLLLKRPIDWLLLFSATLFQALFLFQKKLSRKMK